MRSLSMTTSVSILRDAVLGCCHSQYNLGSASLHSTRYYSQQVYLSGSLSEGWGLGAISELLGGGLLEDAENHGSTRDEEHLGSVIGVV